ncbi:hypothetical protein GCK72_020802 [Caenorhabditis remanei]|uniref:F-box domain-containing protein n=1 Tax=Caenorhabditis remanei TaxID=31234 RepID=A0A6A5GI80_CAERE|nr:hypothetical protein GCK72_020802 [Caenorhabditis remanei]KAF1754242.1 hypothetical protein GCK72_020802 [Caenorhabditis remanei]
MTTTLVLWHNAEDWFKMTDITLALLNGLWILVTHLNALVLIATNRCSKMSNSLDFPNLVMRNVLQWGDMNSILTLRKVSHKLRTFIDEENPDFRIECLNVTVRKDVAYLSIQFDGTNFMSIEYQKKEEFTIVNCDKRERIVKMHYQEVLIKDLRILLRNQKSILKELGITIEDSFPGFKNIFTSRQIRLKYLKMSTTTSKVMEILPNLCPKTLQEVQLMNKNTASPHMELDELMKLGHWQNLKCFVTFGFCFNGSIREFSHFLFARVEIQSATPDDVLFLKELPSFKEIRFKSMEFKEGDRLKELLGPPSFEDDSVAKWEFSVAGENRKLCILVSKFESFTISNYPV